MSSFLGGASRTGHSWDEKKGQVGVSACLTATVLSEEEEDLTIRFSDFKNGEGKVHVVVAPL